MIDTSSVKMISNSYFSKKRKKKFENIQIRHLKVFYTPVAFIGAFYTPIHTLVYSTLPIHSHIAWNAVQRVIDGE